MKLPKHLLVLSALIAFAATFWLQTPTQAAPPDVRLSLTCYPQSGLMATFEWVPNAEASGQWIDLNHLTNTGEIYEGAGPFPASINSHAMPVHPFSVYTVRIAEYVAVSGAWATSPTFYFETGACAPAAVAPAPCNFPLCGGEFAGTTYGVAPRYAPIGGNYGGPSTNYPAFPPTIAQYPVPGYFVPGAPGFPGGCHPSYVGACVPVGTGDFDCKHGIGNGPNMVGHDAFYVVGPDTYNLDTNGDGVACNAPPEIFHAPPSPCGDHWGNNGWWGDHGDWHDDWDHDGWDDKDWDHHDWDNNHDDWGHNNGCFGDNHHGWDNDYHSKTNSHWDDNDEPAYAGLIFPNRGGAAQGVSGGGADCHPSYIGQCLLLNTDYDCFDTNPTDGDEAPWVYVSVQIVGVDEYGLNGDPEQDNIGCDELGP